jgi:hypothetical protein
MNPHRRGDAAASWYDGPHGERRGRDRATVIDRVALPATVPRRDASNRTSGSASAQRAIVRTMMPSTATITAAIDTAVQKTGGRSDR